MLRACGFIGFAEVVGSPKRLKISPSEAGALLRRVREIKAGARHDMVDMPLAIVLPSHARLKLRFQPAAEETDVAANQIKGAGGLGKALDGSAKADSEVAGEFEGGFGISAVLLVGPIIRLGFRQLTVNTRPRLNPRLNFRPLIVGSHMSAVACFAPTVSAKLAVLLWRKLLQQLFHPTLSAGFLDEGKRFCHGGRS